jgi:hypothetical protein
MTDLNRYWGRYIHQCKTAPPVFKSFVLYLFYAPHPGVLLSLCVSTHTGLAAANAHRLRVLLAERKQVHSRSALPSMDPAKLLAHRG